MSRKANHPHRGITLILAIMIMSAVVAIGITLSAVLVFQVRINQVVKEGHQGYYASESGMELGLNLLNTLKSGLLNTAVQTLTTAVLPPGADAEYSSYFYPTSRLLSQSAQVVSAASPIPIVQENQSVFIELYSPDSSTTAPTQYFIPVLCVYAEGSGDEVLEVSWVGWDTALNLSRAQKIYVSFTNFSSKTSCPITESKGYGFSVPLEQFYPAFAHDNFAGFRIRVTPLKLTATTNGDVKNMAVYTNPKPPSQIQLKSVSTAAGQKQALVALFPWSLPLSSLFDFVIFSEKTITKSVPITIAQDLKRYGPFTAVDGGPTGIPPTPTDPFSTCVATPCTYYIRLIAVDGSGGWNQTGSTCSDASVLCINTSGTGGIQAVPVLNASSCILKMPYLFSATSGTITFTSLPTTLTKYELLTRPAFSTADENYCP